ncbi:MAG: peptidoglycan DD-metalloendopeptidase family protein [Acidimicrobiales bacterium]|nr:peptidoglycan DD-metalloendopeptidase family protein [Acidimicrobiales bacterium]
MRIQLFRSRLVIAALIAAGVLVGSNPGRAEDLSDLRRQREEAREAEQSALEQIDLLRADADVIRDTLLEIQALVDAQVARVEGAQQALAAAEAEVSARELLARDAEQAIEDTIAQIRVRAVDAYVGTGDSGLEAWLADGDVNQTAIRIAMLDFTAGSERDLLDDLRSHRAELEINVEFGEAAKEEADRLRSEVEEELAVLRDRRALQLEVQAELATRIDAWLLEADERSQASDEFTDLIRAETAAATGLAAGSESLKGFIMPTTGRIGSAFGPRVHPIFGTVRQHTGVDIGASSGNPIWASKDGRVIFAGWKGGYGNTVVMVHGDGTATTLYAHMSVIQASVGDMVDQGEVVGLIGSTGFSTGPHLHFEVRVNGTPKDPVAFLP